MAAAHGGDKPWLRKESEMDGLLLGRFHLQANGRGSVESSPTCTSTKYAKLIHLFVGMGFSRDKVIRAIEENGEENEEDILETLLTLTAMTTLEDCSPGPSSRPCAPAKKSDEPIDIFDEDSCPGSEEKTFNFKRDETLLVLVNMGYPFNEALIAIEKCGPEAQICELTDFICAAQLEKEIDSHLQDSPNKKHDVSVYTHKKQRYHDYFHTNKRVKLHNEKWKSKICWESNKKPSAIDMEIKQMQFTETIAGFGIHNQLCPLVARKLPHKVASGQPYFYYENVASAPKGVWSKISRFLFEIEPEFVDSKYFCAATRKRGYIHNLPIENRSPLLPIPPLTIQEALPTTKRWWPSWDTRRQLNCLLTSIAPATVTDRIRKVLEDSGAEPPPNVQDYILRECRKWNLIWVGKNKVAPLEPDEYEMLLGFPKDHTRGGGISRILRYRALGNTFQVESPILKELGFRVLNQPPPICGFVQPHDLAGVFFPDEMEICCLTLLS